MTRRAGPARRSARRRCTRTVASPACAAAAGSAGSPAGPGAPPGGQGPGFPAVRAGPGRAQAGRQFPQLVQPLRPQARGAAERAQALGEAARAGQRVPHLQPQAAVWLRQAGPRRAEELGRRVVLARAEGLVALVHRRAGGSPQSPPRQGGGTGSGLRPHSHPRRRAQGKPGTTGFGQLRQARPPPHPQRRRLPQTLPSSPRATPRASTCALVCVCTRPPPARALHAFRDF